MDSWKINWVEKSWQIFWIKGKNLYLLNRWHNSSEDKKAKDTEKYVIKRNSNLKSLKTVSKQLNLRIR